jgi:hypothetical protein
VQVGGMVAIAVVLAVVTVVRVTALDLGPGGVAA